MLFSHPIFNRVRPSECMGRFLPLYVRSSPADVMPFSFYSVGNTQPTKQNAWCSLWHSNEKPGFLNVKTFYVRTVFGMAAEGRTGNTPLKKVAFAYRTTVIYETPGHASTTYVRHACEWSHVEVYVSLCPTYVRRLHRHLYVANPSVKDHGIALQGGTAQVSPTRASNSSRPLIERGASHTFVSESKMLCWRFVAMVSRI